MFTLAQVGIQSVVLFLTYRLAASTLGLSVLGLWSVASAAATFGRIGDLGFGGAVPRLLAERLGRGEGHSISAMVETAVLASTLGTLLLTVIFFVPLLLFTQSLADGSQQSLALQLVVGANIALVLTGLSVTFLACLEGMGCFGARASIVIGGTLLNLLVLWVSVDQFGALSLPAGLVVQGLTTTIAAWLMLRSQLPGLSVLPKQWSRSEFRALFAIGKFTQANSLLIMAFEPMSRVLAGHFGGAGFAALFDFAAKVTGNVRLLFSSFTQSLVPFFAYSCDRRQATAALFSIATLLIAVIASAVTALTLGASPWISIFIFGRVDEAFLAIFWVLLIGNLINVMGGPAFAHALGAGRVAISMQTLALQAAIFLLLSALLSLAIDGQAVSLAYATAVAVAGCYSLHSGLHLLAREEKLIRHLTAALGPTLTVIAVLIVGVFLLPPGFQPFVVLLSALTLLADLCIRYHRRMRSWAAKMKHFRISPRLVPAA
ncbi:MAG: hypothetical protein V4709_02670 [Pseudomonadota bacterium]